MPLLKGEVAAKRTDVVTKTKTSAALIYGGRVRVLFGGSRWPSALPTGGSQCVQAQPAGNAGQQSAENSADSKNPAALIYGGRVRVLFGGSRNRQRR